MKEVDALGGAVAIATDEGGHSIPHSQRSSKGLLSDDPCAE